MVPLCFKAQTSLALVELLEDGGAQPVQREASGLDQQPDRMRTMVGQADLAPQPPLLRIRLVSTGSSASRSSPSSRCSGPIGWSRAIASWAAIAKTRAHKRRRHPHGPVGGGLGRPVAYTLGRLPVGLTTETLLQAPGHRFQVNAQGGQRGGVTEMGAGSTPWAISCSKWARSSGGRFWASSHRHRVATNRANFLGWGAVHTYSSRRRLA